MNSIRNTALPVIACWASLALSACSGGPGESDVRAAVYQQMQDQQKAQTAALGSSTFLDQQFSQQRKALDTLKLIGCKADGDKAYNCDIEVGGKVISGRFVKSSNGWIVES